MIGYRKNENDEYESESQYMENMCGIVALYASIIQMKLVPNTYSMNRGWTWIARLLNMKPRTITPLLLHTFLDIAGF